MIGHFRITLLGRAGPKKTRLLRYHEAEGVEPLEMARRFVDVLAKTSEAERLAVTRVTIERIDAAGRVV